MFLTAATVLVIQDFLCCFYGHTALAFEQLVKPCPLDADLPRQTRKRPCFQVLLYVFNYFSLNVHAD